MTSGARRAFDVASATSRRRPLQDFFKVSNLSSKHDDDDDHAVLSVFPCQSSTSSLLP